MTYDKETEEVYLRARYYQPAVGRFLTRDSYTGESDEPESLHLYTYCENDGMLGRQLYLLFQAHIQQRRLKVALKLLQKYGRLIKL